VCEFFGNSERNWDINEIFVRYSTEEKKLKPKRVESLFRLAVSNLPDAALSAKLLADAEKYLDYLRW